MKLRHGKNLYGLLLIVINVVVNGCDTQSVNRNTIKSQVFVSYNGQNSPLVSLSSAISALHFIDQQGTRVKIDKIDKKIDLAITLPCFLTAFSLPVGRYVAMEVHLDISSAQAIIHDKNATENSEFGQAIDAQLVSTTGYLIPQQVTSLVKKVRFKTPFVLDVGIPGLINIDFLTHESISLVTNQDNDNYLAFDPELTITHSIRSMIDGTIEQYKKGWITLRSDDEALAIKVSDWLLNGLPVDVDHNNPGVLAGKKVSVDIQQQAQQKYVIQANVISRERYIGMFNLIDNLPVMSGHQLHQENGITFFSNTPILFDDSLLADAQHINPGQLLEVYVDKDKVTQQAVIDSMLFIPTDFVAEVVSVDKDVVIEPRSIMGKEAKSFYRHTLLLNRRLKDVLKPFDLIDLKGFFLADDESDFRVTAYRKLSVLSDTVEAVKKKGSLRIDFDRDHSAQLNIRKFANVEKFQLEIDSPPEFINVQATYLNRALSMQLSIDTLWIKEGATLLIQQQGIVADILQETVPELWMTQLKTLLVDNRLHALIIQGTAQKDEFIANHIKAIVYPLEDMTSSESDEFDFEGGTVSERSDKQGNHNVRDIVLATTIPGGVILFSGVILSAYYAVSKQINSETNNRIKQMYFNSKKIDRNTDWSLLKWPKKHLSSKHQRLFKENFIYRNSIPEKLQKEGFTNGFLRLESVDETTRITENPKWLYRGDARMPDKIFPEGFKAKGTIDDLQNHSAYGARDGTSAYISTSKLISVAGGFSSGDDFRGNTGEGYVYLIANHEEGFDINKMRSEGKLEDRASLENEVVFKNKIPTSDIRAVRFPDGHWELNSNFSKRKNK